jgi:hypothetical protein
MKRVGSQFRLRLGRTAALTGGTLLVRDRQETDSACPRLSATRRRATGGAATKDDAGDPMVLGTRDDLRLST